MSVIRPGMLTTVQDRGRWGMQAQGVPVAGPMDGYSHALANRLVGNVADAAALEITLIGPELRANVDITCAVAGAPFEISVDGAVAPMHAPFVVKAGGRLRFGARTAGARATLAIHGGIDVPPVCGSRATSLISKMGPFGGGALRAGDELPIGAVLTIGPTAGFDVRPLPMPNGGARLRLLSGPQVDAFTPAAFETLFHSRFVITPASNRMGYRLEGPHLAHAGGADILSDATPLGSVQVPASGQPILLMADRQTTGGYPKIGVVASADVPLAGQLAPGDWVEFAPCTQEAAVAALKLRFQPLVGGKLASSLRK